MALIRLQDLTAHEWQYLGDTEAVTFFRKTADGAFDAGTPVANAYRLEVDKDQQAGGVGAKVKARLHWLLWSVQAGSVPAKTGDRVVDGAGVKWVVEKAHIQAWGTRYFLETVQER